jgi:hypothetical protein
VARVQRPHAHNMPLKIPKHSKPKNTLEITSNQNAQNSIVWHLSISKPFDVLK